MSRQETTALSTLSTPTATATQVGAAPNPFVMVQDRLQNRWRVCLFVGLLLGAALATTVESAGRQRQQ